MSYHVPFYDFHLIFYRRGNLILRAVSDDQIHDFWVAHAFFNATILLIIYTQCYYVMLTRRGRKVSVFHPTRFETTATHLVLLYEEDFSYKLYVGKRDNEYLIFWGNMNACAWRKRPGTIEISPANFVQMQNRWGCRKLDKSAQQFATLATVKHATLLHSI